MLVILGIALVLVVVGLMFSDDDLSKEVRAEEIKEKEIAQPEISIPNGCYDKITKRDNGV